jgi:hypothetical protein
MEILVGIAFAGIIIFFAVRKFQRGSKGKDCCK